MEDLPKNLPENPPGAALARVMAQAALIAAHDEPHPFEAVVPPIVQTSLFTFATVAEMLATFRGEQSRYVYSRTTNPTVRLFEQKLAALEATEDAIGFASGMGAISAAILAFVSPGDHIVCVRHVYPDAYRFCETLLKKWQVTTHYVDGHDLAAVQAALKGSKLLYLESPTSWTMECLDIGALAQLARDHGAWSIIDNSWASPIFQQPATLGVDLVLHSASKYIGGHSDVVAGVIAGRTALIDQIRRTICPYLGAKLAPFDAWLLVRGLRTLPTRMKAHETAATHIAHRLARHPRVTRVYHPSLANQLPPGLLGCSGLLSFEFEPSVNIPAFCDALQLFQIGISWGGHESLVVPAVVSLSQAGGPNSAVAFEIPPTMVRLHIGLEGAEALWADFEQALEGTTR